MTQQATEKTGLSRQARCNRLAMEFQDGSVVNLGFGMPTLCSNYDFKDRTVIFQSENGVIGYGPLAAEGEEDLHLNNASGQYVTMLPGAAIIDQSDSFCLIRAGYIDAVVLGAYEVAENGDFANWKTAGRKGGGIGGAMDLAVGAGRVFIAMDHTTRDGEPRLMPRCTLPVTALGVVSLVATNLGLFEAMPDGFVLKEIAPGFTPEEVQAQTAANLIVPDDLKEVSV
jgi:3-oxoacid CoA-transferase B subunit